MRKEQYEEQAKPMLWGMFAAASKAASNSSERAAKDGDTLIAEFEKRFMPKNFTAAEVMDFLDTFAGQENTAEEVRDFVQLAARYIDLDKSNEEWEANETLAMFVEWAKEQRR